MPSSRRTNSIRAYALGLFIVVAAVVIAATYAPLVQPYKPARAAWGLRGQYPPLSAFQLTNQANQAISERQLASRAWIASFIFTRCKASCPRISTTMKELQRRLAGSRVQLVSISVDPTHDTPEVLARYAAAFGADSKRWWFLTGDKDVITKLVREEFHLPLAPMDPNDPVAAMMDVAHSDRLALVDRNNELVGLYDAQDKTELDELVKQAKRLDRAWARQLPTVNASLNGASAVLLLIGWPLILTRRVRGHMAAMIAALTLSGLFLGCYLLYHAMIGGGVPFQGTGLVRLAYFTVLISHVVLAAVMVPLIILTVLRAIRGDFRRHARLARITYPIWLYVSFTGVIVYVMLYVMPVIPKS